MLYMQKEKVAIIIISFRTSHLMNDLIHSIDENEVEYSIFIVDNASTKESYEQLLDLEDNKTKILKSDKNLGFTGGINFALKHIIESKGNFQYFFLLNPDAFSCKNLIGDLVHILKQNNEVAAVSPKILYLNGNPWYSGAQINYKKGQVINNSYNNFSGSDQLYAVDVFSGCAVLFDFLKVTEAGMFSEDLFMYFDEAELAIRLKKNGHKILYSPSHEIFHDVSYTTRNISHLKTYYMTRNKFIVFNQSMSLYNKIYFMLYELAFHIKNKRIKNAFYHIKGFYDFIKGKKGPYLSQ
jgi:GT2 family glycosyltransferase